jgi:hypothetical protein
MTLVSRLQDQINSCGFVVQFVIDAQADEAVPASCDALLACCDSLPSDQLSKRNECVDSVDNLPSLSSEWRSGVCPATTARFCGDAGTAVIDDADSGVDAVSTRHGLCCYRTCGLRHCT